MARLRKIAWGLSGKGYFEQAILGYYNLGIVNSKT